MVRKSSTPSPAADVLDGLTPGQPADHDLYAVLAGDGTTRLVLALSPGDMGYSLALKGAAVTKGNLALARTIADGTAPSAVLADPEPEVAEPEVADKA